MLGALSILLLYFHDEDQSDDLSLPLYGNYIHDFGMVNISDEPVSMSHVFTLENRSDETVEIEKVATTCGCTSYELSSEVVKPGETVTLEATLEISRPGARREKIILALKDHGPLTLTIGGIGRNIENVQVLQRSISLDDDSEGIIQVVLNTRDDINMPLPQPIITSPSQGEVEYVVLPWRLIHPADEDAGIPNRWHTELRIYGGTKRIIPNGRDRYVQVSIGDVAPFFVSTDGKAWNYEIEIARSINRRQ